MTTNTPPKLGQAAHAERGLFQIIGRVIPGLQESATAARRLNVADVRCIEDRVRALTSNGARAKPHLCSELGKIELGYQFSAAGAALFQTMLGKLGIDSACEIRVPVEDKPYWMRVDHPLTHYRSKPALPTAGDVVIIGAGLTGVSAAYHLSKANKAGLRIILLDKGGPASEASGRNGGNFELLPENSVGIYEGLVTERAAFLHLRYPTIPSQILRAESERQASIILGVALRNRNAMRQIIDEENIECDFSPRGWLYLAHTESEEQAICDEVVLAAEHQQKIEIWSRKKIRDEFGFDRGHMGRFIPGDGTYHPFKFVCGVLEKCLAAGVELYTGVSVREVVSSNAGRHSVITGEGNIVAGSVVVATNAFTAQIFPELNAIQATQSQIAVTEFAPDRCRGRIVTSEEGPVYFNQPRTDARYGLAPLLMGGGADRRTDTPSSRRRNVKIHSKLLRLRESFFPELKNRPFSTEWVGVCGFTPDELPAVGFLRPGIVIASGFNGYGGSYCFVSGQVAATMALSGAGPEWLPDDIFSPKRLLTDSPLFMDGTDRLWRIASSLCSQLHTVNKQIADAISFSFKTTRSTARTHFRLRLADAMSSSATTVDGEMLCSLPDFRELTPAEAGQLLRFMKRWDLESGTCICSQGSPGDSCFVVLSGAVSVSMQVQGQQRLLSTLVPGNIFGQVALIEEGMRSATCATLVNSVVLELEREACKRLFASGSAAALNFMAAMNHGLIDALRGANRQLMRLTVGDRMSRAPRSESSAPERGRPFQRTRTEH